MGPWSVWQVRHSQERWQDPPALGFRLITPVQLPLADHPQALQVISASPMPCSIAADAMGKVFTPHGGVSIPGWGRRKSPERAAGEKLGSFTAPNPLCQQNYPYLRVVIFQQCKYFLNELEGGGLMNAVLLENVTKLGTGMA